jgi:hypothetical protein
VQGLRRVSRGLATHGIRKPTRRCQSAAKVLAALPRVSWPSDTTSPTPLVNRHVLGNRYSTAGGSRYGCPTCKSNTHGYDIIGLTLSNVLSCSAIPIAFTWKAAVVGRMVSVNRALQVLNFDWNGLASFCFVVLPNWCYSVGGILFRAAVL